MGQSIREVMTRSVVTISPDRTVGEASRLMRDHNIGDVVVVDAEGICGIVTDRDIVVRAMADGHPPDQTLVAAVASEEVMAVSPDDMVKDVVAAIRGHAIRRIPVVENGKPVGIVTIGDLAIERDSASALADISAAKPNN